MRRGNLLQYRQANLVITQRGGTELLAAQCNHSTVAHVILINYKIKHDTESATYCKSHPTPLPCSFYSAIMRSAIYIPR